MKHVKLFEDFAAVGVAPEGNVGGMGNVVAPSSTTGSGDAWPSLGVYVMPFSKFTRKKKKTKKLKK